MSQRIKESEPSKDLHHQTISNLFGLRFYSDHWLFCMAESGDHNDDDDDDDNDDDDDDSRGHPGGDSLYAAGASSVQFNLIYYPINALPCNTVCVCVHLYTYTYIHIAVQPNIVSYQCTAMLSNTYTVCECTYAHSTSSYQCTALQCLAIHCVFHFKLHLCPVL